MNFVASLIENVDVVLQLVLVVLLLLASNYRRYPLLFTYSVILFSLTLLETWFVRHGTTFASARWRNLYWPNEMVVDLLLFFMVIGLTLKALEGSALRDKMKRLLLVVAATAALLPLFIFPARFSPRWFYSTSQLLNFAAAILNLALWGAMLGNRKRDARLLAVSAGLGVAVTGAAIAFGLRQFTSPSGVARPMVDLFKSATHAASMMIWCWAFLPHPKRQAEPRPATTAP